MSILGNGLGCHSAASTCRSDCGTDGYARGRRYGKGIHFQVRIGALESPLSASISGFGEVELPDISRSLKLALAADFLWSSDLHRRLGKFGVTIIGAKFKVMDSSSVKLMLHVQLLY